MNFLLVTSSLLFALSHLVHCHSSDVPAAHFRFRRGAGKSSGKSAGFITALSAVAKGGGSEGGDSAGADSYDLEDGGQTSSRGSGGGSGPLDRNMVVACTNRHNCEMTCSKAKTAKYASKAAFLDALARSIGEAALTDAHRLGLQFGRRRAPCEKCALVYSNCDNALYGVARQQLFAWRSTPDDLISLPKSSSNSL